MDILIKAAAICIPSAVFAAAIKKDNPAMSLILAIAAGLITLYLALGAMNEISSFFKELSELTGMSSQVISIVAKTTAIAIIANIASGICKDAGFAGAAGATEFAGAAAALYVALPLMRSVLRMINELI